MARCAALAARRLTVAPTFRVAGAHPCRPGVPAVTFTYDLSPMQVIIAEESEGLFRFVVYVFAIIGGGFTVFGMIDGLVYHSDRLLREKVGLGKAA